MRFFFGSIARLLLGMLVIGCNTVDPDECWVNTSGGFGGGGTLPLAAGVGATTSGDFLSPPPKGPLDESGKPNPCVATPSPPESPPAGIVDCTFRVDNPHESMHFPGTVNVIATLTCNRPVSGIEMTIGLARDGQEVISRTFTNSGVASLRENVATTLPCVSGAYQGAAVALVSFPPPSLPASGILHANSATLPVTCKK
jgi:hypothetical protein